MLPRCILVPVTPGMELAGRLDAGRRLAHRTHGHIDALFVQPDPTALFTTLPDILQMRGTDIADLVAEGEKVAIRTRDAFHGWCGERCLPTEPTNRLDAMFASWREERGDLETIVALEARVHDLTVIGRPSQASPYEAALFDAAVFSSGRPALVIGDHLPDDLLRHVVIAWNGSVEASRAVGLATALLHEASEISIFVDEAAIPHALPDLGSFLRWHGIEARQIPPAAGQNGPTGEALVEACKRCEATMLVMGAYTHSRIRQMVLGGVTSHVLNHAQIPVLMAH